MLEAFALSFAIAALITAVLVYHEEP